MAQQRHPPGPPMTLGNMRDLGVRNLRAEAERKAIVDAQEIVAIWNAERVVSQLADREPPPVAFLSWDRTAERTGTRRAIPPNHKMNVVRCRRARLGFGANKKGKRRQCPPRSISDLSRLVAARRLAIVSIILPEKNFIASRMSLKQELNSWILDPTSLTGWLVADTPRPGAGI